MADHLLIVAGFALLIAGGEAVVRGAVALAERLGVSPLIVGLTIVGFGTSLPELVVCVNAALAGAPGLAVGNVIGSNVANTLMILGAAALVLPVAVAPEATRRDGPCVAAATVLFVALGLAGGLSWWQGSVLLAALLAYVALAFRQGKRAGAPPGAAAAGSGRAARRLPGALALAAAGFACVVLGAELLVTGASGLARRFGVPDEVIGLTVVAVVTSLPELATGVVAAYRGRSDICLGNVLGSNLFNLFGIAGATALAAPLPFSGKILSFDLWVLLGTVLLLAPFMLTGRRIGRIEGGALLALYCAYVASQFLGLSGAA